MGRLLFILAIVAVIIWWLKAMRNQQQPPRQDEQPPRGAEDMVRCAQCGVHLPRSESLLVGGKYYCSEAHSRGSSDKTE